MKMKSFSLVAAGVLAAASAQAQTIIDVTGSTAGRSSVHDGIIATLSNVTYGFSGSSLGSASFAIFKGDYNGSPVIVRTSWSGSAAGLAALAAGSNVNFIPTSTTVAAAPGTSGLANGSDPSAAEVAFSDVFVSSTTVPSTGLTNTNTFVIPFKWIASAAANAKANFTNVTPVQARSLYNLGTLPLSFFTGVQADETVTVVATGRDGGSGTRISTLADIGYGVFSAVQQAQVTVSGSDITGFTDFPAGPDGGYSSGGTLAGVLNKNSTGGAANTIVLGYLGLSDANTALTTGVPAKELTYNGVAYSLDNVITGKYSLWGYLHLYYRNTLSGVSKAFSDALGTYLLTHGGSSGIDATLMKVERLTDGGNITVKP